MNYPNGIAYVGGEFEIEKLQVQEVEIKQELLPVFDHFHSIKSGWCGRYYNLSDMIRFFFFGALQVFHIGFKCILCTDEILCG